MKKPQMPMMKKGKGPAAKLGSTMPPQGMAMAKPPMAKKPMGMLKGKKK